MKRHFFQIGMLSALLAFAGCATQPYDYTNFRAHPPRSIVVLPPLNNSTEVKATYGYLTTVTQPVAEQGFYVFPVAEVDELMKQNGLPTPGEMHQAPLNKIGEVFGADAVLYLTVNQYGQVYQVLSSTTIVTAQARLVDVKTGTLLWGGNVSIAQGSGDSGGGIIGALITAAVTQVINSAGDPAHDLSATANRQMFRNDGHGLLHGPYFPKDKEK